MNASPGAETTEVVSLAAPSEVVCTLAPLPLRAGSMAMEDVIDLYMAHYAGRDTTRVQRLTWWRGKVGKVALQDLTDDHVYAGLEALAQQPARYWAGTDADGCAIYKAKRAPLAAATINRYGASISAVITWAIKRRIAPKGYVHPGRSIERRTENNERTRYLSDDERERLLAACRASSWPRLYVLVLMALTTGARKAELTGLRWGDVDLERAVALVGRTKNGDPRVLPLVENVVQELKRFKAGPSVLVFPSRAQPDKPFTFEPRWAGALKAARVRGFTFHSLRHSCASMLAQNGATLLEIADVLGHRQLQMTKRYSHLATSHKAALVQRVLGQVG
jgi:integrase